MSTETSYKLVQYAKRAQNLPSLPPYATDLVRNTVREVAALDATVNQLLAPYTAQGQGFDPASDPSTACALLVRHLSMRRDKRCLLAYHRVRAQRLTEAVWKGWGTDILAGQQPYAQGGKRPGAETGTAAAADGESNLSPEEEEYVRQYGELLAAYKGRWTDIDLTGSLEPPRDLFIDVRALRDAGEIQTEYGSINLTKNSQFYVRQGDVERLIAQGYLQRLD